MNVKKNIKRKTKKIRMVFFYSLFLTLLGCSSVDNIKNKPSSDKKADKPAGTDQTKKEIAGNNPVTTKKNENNNEKKQNKAPSGTGLAQIPKPEIVKNEVPVKKRIVAKFKGKYGIMEIDSTGSWSYLVDDHNKEIMALPEGGILFDTINIKSKDGTIKPIKIKIKGKNDIPVFTGQSEANLKEDKVITGRGKLTVDDVDAGESSFIPSKNIIGDYGTLSINEKGEWEYNLDNKKESVQALKSNSNVLDTFQVNSKDGTPTKIKIYIEGTNDTPVFTGDFRGTTEEDKRLTTSGIVKVKDTEPDEAVFQQVISKQGKYGTFTINPNGEWFYSLNNENQMVQALTPATSLSESFQITTADNTKRNISITIHGINDTPAFFGQATGEITEDKENTITGKVDISDADNNESFFMPLDNQTVKYGNFSITSTGDWKFVLNNTNSDVQALGQNSFIIEEIPVEAVDGSKIKIKIKINGTNDVPTAKGVSTGSVTEDNKNTSVGTITLQDVDAGESGFRRMENIQGKYGSLSINSNGEWIYKLNNNNNNVQTLNQEKTLNDTIKVYTTDGTALLIKVVINGTNDVPTITGTASERVIDQVEPGAMGNLYVSDTDNGESKFIPAERIYGKYGVLRIDEYGKWEYALNPNDKTVQALSADEKITDIINVKTIDQTVQPITITIFGTNNLPIIKGNSEGTVKEDTVNTANGKLIVMDIDTGQSGFKPVEGLSGEYGSLTINSKGEWVYTLDNSNKTVQSLPEGKSITDIIEVETADGTVHPVTITINGTDDVPVFSGKMFGDISLGENSKIEGKLDIIDSDAGESSLFFQEEKEEPAKKNDMQISKEK